MFLWVIVTVNCIITIFGQSVVMARNVSKIITYLYTILNFLIESSIIFWAIFPILKANLQMLKPVFKYKASIDKLSFLPITLIFTTFNVECTLSMKGAILKVTYILAIFIICVYSFAIKSVKVLIQLGCLHSNCSMSWLPSIHHITFISSLCTNEESWKLRYLIYLIDKMRLTKSRLAWSWTSSSELEFGSDIFYQYIYGSYPTIWCIFFFDYK